MESFFLAETTKYLYLLFDPDNFLNSDGRYGTIIDTKNGECIIESSYIFNTEAHPIDLGSLKCCYDLPRESLVGGFNRNKFLGDIAMEKYPIDVEMSVKSGEIDDDVKANDDFKKQLLEEIISALSNTEKKIKDSAELQKRLVQVSNRDKEEEITKEQVAEDKDNEKLEIIRLSTNELEADDVNQSKYEEAENDISKNQEEVKGPENKSNRNIKTDVKIIKKSAEKNNSIITEFVKNILKTAQTKPKNFDPQTLLEKIQSNSYGFVRNKTWTTKYDILTCKAQAYGNRISVMGEFY